MIPILKRSFFNRLLLFYLFMFTSGTYAQQGGFKFKVIAFYTGQNDRVRVSYVHEANRWFNETAKQYKFSYDSTNNWDNLNLEFLAKYDIVLFLDARPDEPEQRAAFEQYMKRGWA